MLVAQGLGKRFGRRWVFRDLSFSGSAEQILGIFGPNGSGKSTLLRVLAGLTPASQGTVQRGVQDPRLAIGYAALDLALYPELSGAEHLILAAKLRGTKPRTDELLIRVGLPARQPTREYSSGMRARLRLALSIQHAPHILLLDEPSASLDAEGRALVKGVIEEQLTRGMVILATNDDAEKEWAHQAITLG